MSASSQFAHVFVAPSPSPSHSSASSSISSASSPASSSKKRKRDASKSTFTNGTRDKTKILCGEQCFHCGLTAKARVTLDVCHVVRKTSAIYTYLRKDGLFDFDLDDVTNSILFCRNCHDAFDNIEPSFTLIPTHLEFFIDFERKDFERRRREWRLLREGVQGREEEEGGHQTEAGASTKARAETIIPPRRCPTVAEYLAAWVEKEPRWPSSAIGGAYTQYAIPDFPLRQPPDKLQAWHGAPTAAIVHAFRAVLGSVAPPGFVPQSIKRQLRLLQDLYERSLEDDGDDNSEDVVTPRPARKAVSIRPYPSVSQGPSFSSMPPPPLLPPRDPSQSQSESQSHPPPQSQNEFQRRPLSPLGRPLQLPPISQKRHRSPPSHLALDLEGSSQKRRRRRRHSSPPLSTPDLIRSPSSLISRDLSPLVQHDIPPTSQHDSSQVENKKERNGGRGEKWSRLGVDARTGHVHDGWDVEPDDDDDGDVFGHVFRHHWNWGGPQQSTEDSVRLYIGAGASSREME